MKLLMIGTDEKIFETNSAVRLRQIEYANKWEELHIVVFSQKKIEEQLSKNCWVYSTNSFFKLGNSIDAIKKSIFLIKKHNITNITCQDPFVTSIVGVFVKNKFKEISLEIQVHTDIGSEHFTYTMSNKIRKLLALSLIKKADKIRVVSEKLKIYISDFLKNKKIEIEVRPIFVDVEKIKKANIIVDLHKKYPKYKKIILMASRLEKEKNFILAIKSFKKVLNVFPDTGLLIVGSGSLKYDINKQIKNMKITGNVVMEDWVSSEELYSYYKTADIFLNTSLYEGYGMSLLESKASGVIVVSTDVGIAREIGVNIVEFNIDSVYDCLIKILKL